MLRSVLSIWHAESNMEQPPARESFSFSMHQSSSQTKSLSEYLIFQNQNYKMTIIFSPSQHIKNLISYVTTPQASKKEFD